MPLLVFKAKFRGETWGERNLRTKAISVLELILNGLAIVLRYKTASLPLISLKYPRIFTSGNIYHGKHQARLVSNNLS